MYTFEQFLQDKHSRQYVGLDDEMSDDFDQWLQDLSVDEWIAYGDLFTTKMLIDQVQNITKEMKNDFAK